MPCSGIRYFSISSLTFCSTSARSTSGKALQIASIADGLLGQINDGFKQG